MSNGVDFWNTVMGRRLIEGTLPDLVRQLKRCADALERVGVQGSADEMRAQAKTIDAARARVDAVSAAADPSQPMPPSVIARWMAVLAIISARHGRVGLRAGEFVQSMTATQLREWLATLYAMPLDAAVDRAFTDINVTQLASDVPASAKGERDDD